MFQGEHKLQQQQQQQQTLKYHLKCIVLYRMVLLEGVGISPPGQITLAIIIAIIVQPLTPISGCCDYDLFLFSGASILSLAGSHCPHPRASRFGSIVASWCEYGYCLCGASSALGSIK